MQATWLPSENGSNSGKVQNEQAERDACRQPRSRMIVQTAGFALGAQFLFLIGVGSTEFVLCLAMIGYGFFKGMYDSHLFAAVYDVVEAKYSTIPLQIGIFPFDKERKSNQYVKAHE